MITRHCHILQPQWLILLSALIAVVVFMSQVQVLTQSQKRAWQLTNRRHLLLKSRPENLILESFNMSFPGVQVSCYSSIPKSHELTASSQQGLMNATYNLCCLQGNLTCRTASRPLRLPLSVVREIEASEKTPVDLATTDLKDSLAFITGASQSHYQMSLLLLNSIHRFFPKIKTLYWDMGLSQKQAESVKRVCGVVYKRFNFTKYPPHMAALKTCAFKSMALMESLTEYPVLWWVDTSIRLTSSNLDDVLKLLKQRHGLLLFRDPSHSVFSTTNPQMYEFISTDVEKLKKTVTAPGGSFIVANTKEIFKTVLYWFYACSLDAKCIAPVLSPGRCRFKGNAVYAECHRYDQSLLTMLAANVWGFNNDHYRHAKTIFNVNRTGLGPSYVEECASTFQ